MDWDKYKRYGNCDYQGTVNFWDIVNKANNVMGYTGDGSEFDYYFNNNVVADVTDSYKELSSERVE